MEEKIIAAIIVSAIAFFSIYVFTPVLIKFLENRNLTVKDANKKGNIMIPRPGGIFHTELVLLHQKSHSILFPISEVLAIIIVSILGFLLG